MTWERMERWHSSTGVTAYEAGTGAVSLLPKVPVDKEEDGVDVVCLISRSP